MVGHRPASVFVIGFIRFGVRGRWLREGQGRRQAAPAGSQAGQEERHFGRQGKEGTEAEAEADPTGPVPHGGPGGRLKSYDSQERTVVPRHERAAQHAPRRLPSSLAVLRWTGTVDDVSTTLGGDSAVLAISLTDDIKVGTLEQRHVGLGGPNSG